MAGMVKFWAAGRTTVDEKALWEARERTWRLRRRRGVRDAMVKEEIRIGSHARR
jgi:hypothetical protein